MEDSPEHTVIMRTMKDFNQFINSASRYGHGHGASTISIAGSIGASSRARLDFSDAGSEKSMHSLLGEDHGASTLSNSRKRQMENSMVGFDVCKRLREKDSEIVNYKVTKARLESTINNLDTDKKKLQLENETELISLRQRNSMYKELTDDLQHKIKTLQAREKNIQDDAQKVKKEATNARFETERKSIAQQKGHLQQTTKLQEDMGKLREELLTLQKDVDKKDCELVRSEGRANIAERQVIVLENKNREMLYNNKDMEELNVQLQAAYDKIKRLECKKEELQNMEHFQSVITRMPALESEVTKLRYENKMLKETQFNTELLEEKLYGAQQQVSSLEQRCKLLSQTQASSDAYKLRLKQYEEMLMSELGFHTAPSAREAQQMIHSLQQGDKDLNKSIDTLRASQKSIEEIRTVKLEEAVTMKAKLEKQQQSIDYNANLIKRVQRKLLLITKERDSLKGVLASYESEVTINHSQVSQDKVEKLESQLIAYKEETHRLEEELESALKCVVEGTSTFKIPHKDPGDTNKIKELEKKVLELQVQVESLTNEKEVLELRLESRALKGDYDPTNTKILHFENNPLSRARENRENGLERLQNENAKLMERIKLLESGDNFNLTQRVGTKVTGEGATGHEVNELQEKISSMETRNQRLMEAFKSKSKEMREAVYRLTGYRVDLIENQYKLLNMYADSPEDVLMFEMTSTGELQLMETEFSSGMDDLIEAYLRHEHSYPAFLSAVTLDLFNKQTTNHPQSDSNSDEEMYDDEEEGGNSPVKQGYRPQQMPSNQHRGAFQHNRDEETDEEDDDQASDSSEIVMLD